MREIQEAALAGADIVELRLDFLDSFNPEEDLEILIRACSIPCIVTCRPEWEGGQYGGDEDQRLAILSYACKLGADYVDVELRAAPFFFAGGGVGDAKTKVIVSFHDFEETPDDTTLRNLISAMRGCGGDIAKIAATAQDISESLRMLDLLKEQTEPTIALSMGERGLPARLLAPKYGAYLTFGSLRAGRESAPGQPTVDQLRNLYRLHEQTADTKVYGVVGNPVSHSRSPALHNAAFAATGYNGVYLPLLVDDMPKFLAAFSDPDFAGFSVTIPHKAEALAGAQNVDDVAWQIGAANTLVRQPDGSLSAYNTDWSAAISAIEQGLEQASGGSTSGSSPTADGESPAAAVAGSQSHSPLSGKTVLVLGAGGAGRALAFGALQRGAKVIIGNRSRGKAEDLAAALGGTTRVVSIDDVNSGAVTADVLANTTSVGMQPAVTESPISATAAGKFAVVFDAIYTPLETQLLKDAKAAGSIPISGLEMFVGQAADQFRLFTGKEAPVDLMRKVVLDSL